MSEHSICIIDKQNSDERDAENTLLIWTGILFSEKTVTASWVATIMYIPVRFNHLTEVQKFKMFYNALSQSENNRQGIEQIKRKFEMVQTLKKRHGKSRQQLVALSKMEKMMEDFYARYKETYVKTLEVLKLSALLPLVSSSGNDEQTKPLSVWNLPDNDSLEHSKWIVNLFTDLVTCPERLPLLEAESISEYAGFFEMKLLPAPPHENLVLCEPLFEFPEPLGFTGSQVQVVRSQLSNTSWVLMNELARLSAQMQKISFTEHNFSGFAALYAEKGQPLKEKVQQAVDGNEYFNRVKSESETNNVCRLWIGISSFHTVFSFYTRLGIIDAASEAYAKEATAQKVDLNNACLFLFLEVIKY